MEVVVPRAQSSLIESSPLTGSMRLTSGPESEYKTSLADSQAIGVDGP